MNDHAEATVTNFKNTAEAVSAIIADMDGHPPASLSEALSRLQSLRAALHTSIERKSDRLRATPTGDNVPDYQAILSDISVLAEGVETLTAAIADLVKAEAAAKTTLERTMNKLHAPRTEARVWQKLRVHTT